LPFADRLDMLDSLDKQRLHKLLSNTIPLMCKNTLGCSLEVSVEAFIGITLSGGNASEEVVMVSFKETLLADGRVSSYAWSEVPSCCPDPPPPLVETVAFNVSESSKAERSPPAVDSIDGNASGLERHGEYSQNWVNGRYWTQCSEAALDNVVPVLSRDDGKNVSGTSALSYPLSVPIKTEENDDISRAEDEYENFESDVVIQNTCDTGYVNGYTSVVHHCLPVPCSYGNTSASQRYLSSAGYSLLNSSQASRKIIRKPRTAGSIPVQRLMSSSCSRSRAKIRKASPLAVNTSMHSSHSKVCKMYTYSLTQILKVNFYFP